MRSFLILSSIALGASVNVAYFREELERMRELNVTGATKSAALLFEHVRGAFEVEVDWRCETTSAAGTKTDSLFSIARRRCMRRESSCAACQERP